MEKTVHFTIDPYFALNQLCCIWHEQNVNGNPDYPNSLKYTMSDLLYQRDTMLTHDEWDNIVRTYQEKHGLSGEFTIDVQPELRQELYQIIQEQKRFKDIELGYILQGFGASENLVYDKSTGKLYPSEYAEHYGTLLEILHSEYENEFAAMTQEEKDSFILGNFILVGKKYAQEWYIPDGIGFGDPNKDEWSMSFNEYK